MFLTAVISYTYERNVWSIAMHVLFTIFSFILVPYSFLWIFGYRHHYRRVNFTIHPHGICLTKQTNTRGWKIFSTTIGIQVVASGFYRYTYIIRTIHLIYIIYLHKIHYIFIFLKINYKIYTQAFVSSNLWNANLFNTLIIYIPVVSKNQNNELMTLLYTVYFIII